jgi:SAM-dependent methyltransferase
MVGPDGRVISTDFSSAMVEVARRLGASRRVDDMEYRQLDAEAMDLGDESVDAIVSRAVFMLLADPAGALREARRVLRPGGSLAFVVFTTPDQNPWAAVPSAALVRRGHLAPPQPEAPRVFALADPERARSLVTGAGFGEPLIEQVDLVFHYVDEDDAWNAVVGLNGPMARIVEGLPDDERVATRLAVLDGFGQFRDPDGSYTVPAGALDVQTT